MFPIGGQACTGKFKNKSFNLPDLSSNNEFHFHSLNSGFCLLSGTLVSSTHAMLKESHVAGEHDGDDVEETLQQLQATDGKIECRRQVV